MIAQTWDALGAVVVIWCILAVLLLGCLACLAARRRREQHASIGRNGYGVFVVPVGPLWCRALINLHLFLAVIAPFSIHSVCLLSGALLAALESQWTVTTGYYFALSNTAGLFNPLTDREPVTTVGRFWVAFVGVWIMVIVATIMAMVSISQAIRLWSDRMQTSVCGLFLYVLVYIPCGLLLYSLLFGALLGVLEGWSDPIGQGFFLGISVVDGLANPLASPDITSAIGLHLAIIFSLIVPAVTGAIVGILGSHPQIIRCVHFFEGCLDELDNSCSEEKVPADVTDPDKCQTAVVDKEESGARDGGAPTEVNNIEHNEGLGQLQEEKITLQRKLTETINRLAIIEEQLGQEQGHPTSFHIVLDEIKRIDFCQEVL